MIALAKKSFGVTLLTAGLFLHPLPASGTSAAEPDYSGSFRADYDYRSMGDYSDQDAYGYWYFRGRNLGENRADIYVSGRMHSDLDGTSSSEYDPFGSIDDGSRTDIRLLQFYANIPGPDQNYALRVGRQYVDVADYIQIDGLQAILFENERMGGRVFGGRPTSDYTPTAGDLFAGVSLVGTPWKGNRSRATYARYEDDSEGAVDDHYFFDARQQISDEFRFRTYLSVMNEDIRMGGADLYYISMADQVLDAVLGVRRWGDYSADTRVYSPLTDVLGDLEPFTTAYGRLTTELLSWLYLSPGAMIREPDDSNFTNRRFGRYDLSFILEPADDLSATLAAEYWDVENEDRFLGFSGDIRYRYQKLWELSLGAAYVDYTYLSLADQSVITTFDVNDPGPDPVQVNALDGTRSERTPNVFTYYLRGRWNITEKTSLRLAGEIEDDSYEDDLGYRIRTSIEVRL